MNWIRIIQEWNLHMSLVFRSTGLINKSLIKMNGILTGQFIMILNWNHQLNQLQIFILILMETLQQLPGQQRTPLMTLERVSREKRPIKRNPKMRLVGMIGNVPTWQLLQHMVVNQSQTQNMFPKTKMNSIFLRKWKSFCMMSLLGHCLIPCDIILYMCMKTLECPGCMERTTHHNWGHLPRQIWSLKT